MLTKTNRSSLVFLVPLLALVASLALPGVAEAVPICHGGQVIWHQGTYVGCVFSSFDNEKKGMCGGTEILYPNQLGSCWVCVKESLVPVVKAHNPSGALTVGVNQAGAKVNSFSCLDGIESPHYQKGPTRGDLAHTAVRGDDLTLKPSASRPVKRGMTWVKRAHDAQLGTDWVSCGPSSAKCDPYKGDTPCATELPLLCFKKDNSPNPGTPTNGIYRRWAGGHLTTTAPVRGDSFSTVAEANARCSQDFGEDWGVAEFHDAAGGWSYDAYGNVRDDTRFWVHIDDQPNGICW